jgi:lipopolysaccharide export LptBFGC system permease protein LptF
MTTTVGRYVSHSLLAHLAVMLGGFVGFMLLLELMNRSDENVDLHGTSVLVLAKYAALRLPDLAAFVLPFAVLMATLLMLAKLVRHNEIMALKAAGLSFYRLLLSLVPAALLVGLLHFIVSDQVVPRTSRMLAAGNAEPGAGRQGGMAPRRHVDRPHRCHPRGRYGTARRGDLRAFAARRADVPPVRQTRRL